MLAVWVLTGWPRRDPQCAVALGGKAIGERPMGNAPLLPPTWGDWRGSSAPLQRGRWATLPAFGDHQEHDIDESKCWEGTWCPLAVLEHDKETILDVAAANGRSGDARAMANEQRGRGPWLTCGSRHGTSRQGRCG